MTRAPSSHALNSGYDGEPGRGSAVAMRCNGDAGRGNGMGTDCLGAVVIGPPGDGKSLMRRVAASNRTAGSRWRFAWAQCDSETAASVIAMRVCCLEPRRSRRGTRRDGIDCTVLDMPGFDTELEGGGCAWRCSGTGSACRGIGRLRVVVQWRDSAGGLWVVTGSSGNGPTGVGRGWRADEEAWDRHDVLRERIAGSGCAAAQERSARDERCIAPARHGGRWHSQAT